MRKPVQRAKVNRCKLHLDQSAILLMQAYAAQALRCWSPAPLSPSPGRCGPKVCGWPCSMWTPPPPVGSMMAYDPVKAHGGLGLRGRGVIVLSAGAPIILCAADCIGIGKEGHDVLRQRLAESAGTTAQRVAVHTVRQHDAPECDFGTERLLRDD